MWREGKTLGDKIELERARVCQDPKGRVLAVDHRHWLYCGDAQTLPAVNPDMSSVFEPRQPGDKASATFNEKAQECDVANPNQREPHALLRDDRGVYYFVDRGRTEGAEKNFRLWVGPKGAMVLQKMTNVVSDSAGDIFSTKSGALRLLIDREKSSEWISPKKRLPLRYLDPAENLHVIYAELGVYEGQRLGSPCDDL